MSLLNLLNRATVAAERAAAYIRSAERPSGPDEWSKAQSDFVTEVDRNAERLIVEVLRSESPAGRIVGEELSPDLVIDGLVWIVDPLDGTTNFLHGYPSYAVSVAAAVDGILQAGVVHHVPQSETYVATRGGGAWLGERRLRVSAIEEPNFALVGTGFPFRDMQQLRQ